MSTLPESVIGPFNRRYVLLPVVLALAFLFGLFFIAASGQARLAALNTYVLKSQQRQQSLADLLRFITDAEAGQRGYLITGEAAYMKPLEQAQPQIEPALDRLRTAYEETSDAESLADVRHLRLLTGQKLGEIQSTLALQRQFGTDRAMDLVRTDFGRRTMDEIRRIVSLMQRREADTLASLNSGWQEDLRTTRWLTVGGTIINVLLILLAGALVTRDIRRREEQARNLNERRAELEQEVAERTQELSSLSTHLQEVTERDRAALSRELHDELGGLLIAARMDVSWIERRFPAMEEEVRKRFARVHEALSAGVDVKRRVVEHLRPTLLDNMGLFAAVRWQFSESCGRAGMHCTEKFPDEELQLRPEAAIGIYRLVQESLTNILKHAKAKAVDLALTIEQEQLVIRIKDDGVGIPADRRNAIGSHGLASMRHRVVALGGTWGIAPGAEGGTEVTARLPLSKIALAELESVEPTADAG